MDPKRVAEEAAHAANTFYRCPTCSERVYTFIENGQRICFRCKFDYSEPSIRCSGCFIGCHACKNYPNS